MKPTNYIYLVGLFLILGLAGGCSSGGSDDIPTPPTPIQPTEKDYVNVSKDSLQATSQGNEVQISFTTNKGWTASSSQSWCTLSITSGEKGSVTLKATMTENTTTGERTAIITIKAGTISQQIVITQEAAPKDKLELATTSFTVVAKGKEIQIPFTTDVAWEASSDQEWCTLSATSGEAGENIITATIVQNKELKERKATITIKAGTATPQKVTINQEAAEKDKLELATTSFTVVAEGKEIQIPFTTDVAWEASSDQEWCTLSATSGEAGAQSVTVMIAKNKVKSERKATITLKAGTATPQKVTITQEAAAPDQIDLKEKSYKVGTDGKNIEITFTTNAAWMIASDQSWCTLSKAIGEEGTHTLTVAVDKNTGYEDRTATITLKAGNVQETITISQEKKYQLKVTYTDALNDYSGADVEVKVQCNTEYEISFDANWIQQVKSRSMNEDTILFKVNRNDDTKEREAEITFFNKEKNLKETIKIRQEGKPEDTSVKPSGNIGNMEWG
ncbi:MAG: BACON domain-containing protein [Bacteroidaceae bacterium]|nr:BACON domain-containing protein [Bacteroidaceae bacterium]